MPEVEHPVWFAADKTGAVNHIRLILQNRLNQFGILRRIIFQIGILDDDDISGYLLKPGPESRPFSLVFLPVDHLADQRFQISLQNIPGTVGGKIIHNDNFFLNIRKRDFTHPLNNFSDKVFFVVNRYDN